MNRESRVIKTISEKVKWELTNFAAIPEKACDCGKPVVFIEGSKTFECPRCGCKWKLVVKVKKIKQGSHS
jgi:predicted RNA-binding Zn-ribbon protein involved in translation (DUF1610 family)